jgi:hypothetical protein
MKPPSLVGRNLLPHSASLPPRQRCHSTSVVTWAYIGKEHMTTLKASILIHRLREHFSSIMVGSCIPSTP